MDLSEFKVMPVYIGIIGQPALASVTLSLRKKQNPTNQQTKHQNERHEPPGEASRSAVVSLSSRRYNMIGPLVVHPL